MLKGLNQVIEYIEEHLTDELFLENIGHYAGVSDYHFRQVFFYLSGVSLSEYIKQRRLSEACQALFEGGKVTDVAFQYGYRSLDGFTRAFKQWSGFLPSEVEKQKRIKTFPKLSFAIEVKGGLSMEVQIKELPKMMFAGVSKKVPMQFEGINQAIVELAHTITEEQKKEMHRLKNIEPKEILNISFDADENFLKETGYLTHMIGVATTKTTINEKLDTIQVEANTWAVFSCEGIFPQVMQETTTKVYSQWLPATDYELVNAPNFSFTRMNVDKEGHAYSEIWLAVRKDCKNGLDE